MGVVRSGALTTTLIWTEAGCAITKTLVRRQPSQVIIENWTLLRDEDCRVCHLHLAQYFSVRGSGDAQSVILEAQSSF